MHGTMIMAEEKTSKSETLNSCFPLTLPGWIAGENSSVNGHASVLLTYYSRNIRFLLSSLFLMFLMFLFCCFLSANAGKN
jgi:hypothetical protein